MSGREGEFIFFLRLYGFKKILDWLEIDEFKRDRPMHKRLDVADLFEDFSQDDYINADYSDF